MVIYSSCIFHYLIKSNLQKWQHNITGVWPHLNYCLVPKQVFKQEVSKSSANHLISFGQLIISTSNVYSLHWPFATVQKCWMGDFGPLSFGIDFHGSCKYGHAWTLCHWPLKWSNESWKLPGKLDSYYPLNLFGCFIKVLIDDSIQDWLRDLKYLDKCCSHIVGGFAINCPQGLLLFGTLSVNNCHSEIKNHYFVAWAVYLVDVFLD